MDQIILDCSSRRLTVPANIQHCSEKIIGLTYGFEYNKHFRAMVMRLVGLINVEKIEAQLDSLKFDRLKVALGHLKVPRNTVAHTHLTGTPTIDAPSITLRQFTFIHEGLVDFDRVMRRRKL